MMPIVMVLLPQMIAMTTIQVFRIQTTIVQLCTCICKEIIESEFLRVMVIIGSIQMEVALEVL